MVTNNEVLPDTETIPAGLSPLFLILEYDPAISYAVQQNRIPVIKRLQVGNRSDCSYYHLHLSITSDPVFSDRFETIIPGLAPGELYTIHTVPLILSHRFFREVTSPIHGMLTIEITHHRSSLIRESFPVRVLACDQWGGLGSLPELLSAFITPNASAVSALVRRTQDILYTLTKDSSLTGYLTHDPHRVIMMAKAVYSALQDQKIRYIIPEAGFEKEGQKIRLADSIYRYRMGNCLDLTLLYAGCLERIGLNPLICITEGHAFAGIWLIDDVFGDVVIDECLPIRKRVELHEIAVLDVVTVTSDTMISFEESMKKAVRYITDDSAFRCVIDVRTSRNGRYNIIPLPLIPSEPCHPGEVSDEVTSFERGEREVIVPPSYDQGFDQSTTRPPDLSPSISLIPPESKRPVYPRIERWMHNLLDLSLRNHLLNVLGSGSFIVLLAPDITRLKDAVYEGRNFQILHFDQPVDQPPYSLLPQDPLYGFFTGEYARNRLYCDLYERQLNMRLLSLYTQATRSREESGAETLYLALGTLVWYESDSSTTPLYAPILLIPLEITRKDVRTGFFVRIGDDEPRVNTTLLQRLFQDFQIEIPHIDPLPMDDHGVDVAAVLHQFRKVVKNLPRFEVLDTAIIGHFTFLKYLMWRDLYTHAEKFMENPLVSTLVDPRQFPTLKGEAFCNAAALDESYVPDDVFCPVGADSSQLAAVIAAGKGHTFVLHGPPGTGKSQTITNIIAHCMALGKTVLFVAEKRVALDVVYNRLKESGLAPFCLELHSNKSHKREVLRQFEEVLHLKEQTSPQDYHLYAEYLADLRRALNSYVHALHSERSTGESFYQGLLRLMSLRHTEYIPLSWPDVSACTKETLHNLNEFIRDVQIVTSQMVPSREHVWAGVHCSSWSVKWKTAVDEGIRTFRISLERLTDLFPTLCDILGLNPASPSSVLYEIGSIYHLLRDQKFSFSDDLLCDLRDPHTLDEMHTFIQAGKERRKIWADLSERYHSSIGSIDCSSFESRIAGIHSAWFLRRKALARAIQLDIREYCRVTVPSVEEIVRDLPGIKRMQELDRTIAAFSSRAALLFGRYWNGEDQDWDICEDLLRSAVSVQAAASRIAVNEDEYCRLVTCWSSLTDLLRNEAEGPLIRHQFTAFEKALKEYSDAGRSLIELLHYDPEVLWPEKSTIDLLKAQLSTVKRWEPETSQLKNWCQWNRMKKIAEEKGYYEIIQRFEDATLPPSPIEDLLLRSYYQHWVDGLREQDPVLREFYRPKFEDSIEKFRETDEIFTSLTRKEISARLFARLPQGQDPNEREELGILRHQIQLSRRNMPLRSLFQNIPSILKKIKPCMLMSPISVAQYLDPDSHVFDLVIFDEASQIPVSDAIGAIARGRAAIIVGDPKQLPPTNIFKRVNDNDDEYGTSSVDLESILDECIASGIPEMHLSWHYRSRHESLIAFSNYHFYQNRLFTFPSSHTGRAITLVHVNGVFDSGNTRTNHVEALAVVREIVRRLRDPVRSGDSIGVITFNERQQDLIRSLLEKERRLRPDIEPFFNENRPEAVFIKNLENVQGDERDVILFSVGYGPDKSGKVSLNFGPLNRDGGERRLNVAITRARKEICVFSSLNPDQIDLTRTRKMGVILLKSFLEFAEKGPKAISEACKRDVETEGRPLESEIAHALEIQGYQVHMNVGCGGYRIDIAVIDPDIPGRYILGILCDGIWYREAQSARDRDILTESVLTTLGWRIHRVWCTDWWDEPELERNRIIRIIEEIRREYAPETMVYCPAEDEGHVESCLEGDQETDDALRGDGIEGDITSDLKCMGYDTGSYEESVKSDNDLSRPLTYPEIWYVAYAGDEVLGTKDDLLGGTHDKEIIRVLQEIVAIEGPITQDLCISRLLPHWQITRKTTQVKNKIESLLTSLSFHHETEGKQIFLWSDHKSFLEYVTFRSHPPGDPWQRKADEISIQEYCNAMIHLIKQERTMNINLLSRSIGSTFGIKRMNAALQAKIDQGIILLMNRGELRRKGDVVIYNPE